MANETLNRIDEILKRPRQEWTDEEFELVIEWRVQSQLNSEEYEIKFAALQEELIESAEASYERAEASYNTLLEMKNKAFELLERASV